MKHVWTVLRAALLVAAVVAGCFAPAVAQLLSPNRAAAILREELGHAFASALEAGDEDGAAGGRGGLVSLGRGLGTPGRGGPVSAPRIGGELAVPLVVDTAPRPRGSLHVAENVRFQRAEWAIQKVGSAFLVVFVLAALLGVFGHGLASSATASAADGTLTAEYERFARQGTAWFLRVHATGGGMSGLLLGKSLIDRNEVEQILPQPDLSRATSDGLVLSYGAPVAEVKVRLRPSRPGWFSFRVARGGAGAGGAAGAGAGGAIEVRQFVYF